MADQLTPRGPAAHLSDAMRAASVPGRVEVAAEPPATQVSLRAEPGSPGHAALARELPLPAAVGEVTGTPGDGAVLWLAPDEFLAVAPLGTGLAGRLDAALGEHAGQVVDVSAARAILRLAGPDAPLVLRKSCPADLHARVFPVGTAITTTVADAQVLLWRTGPQEWRVMPRSSFTEHAVRWLIDAMREFAPARP